MSDRNAWARVTARAWTDPEYRERLLEDATAAILELGFSGMQGEHMVAVENSDERHNVVVCTLCSCYPWPVLGVPPVWYKSADYRARVVRDPRGVLAEFDVTLDDDVEIQVWDSTSEIRYLVVPQRPAGTDDMSEAELAELVTRDSMIEVARRSGYEVEESPITRDDLYVADEIFLTGTAAEVTPIREVDYRTIGEGKRGPITEELQTAFFDIVTGKDARYDHWRAFL